MATVRDEAYRWRFDYKVHGRETRTETAPDHVEMEERSMSYDRGNSGRESEKAILTELDLAALTLSRQTGWTKAKAYSQILAQRPELYSRYIQAKKSDFAQGC
jgi:hypothetical protein